MESKLPRVGSFLIPPKAVSPMYRHDDLKNPAFCHYLKDQSGSLGPNDRSRILKVRDNTQMYYSPLPFSVILKAILAPWTHSWLRLVSACPEVVLESHGTTATEKRLHMCKRYGDLMRKHRTLYYWLLPLLSDQRVRASLIERPILAQCTLSYSCTDPHYGSSWVATVSVFQSKWVYADAISPRLLLSGEARAPYGVES